ncbi:polyprenyl synthetase family protein [Rickettsiales endosymbiont of Stachyamoeba lipophora]|uniref:polyprenyl synthetase family protein n=1 Tax=Rickettsiales endosymbiont of Stachyamoeba lipophora TaxID=2486578 RepID=UPI000F64F9FB|nr:polyprenyl synthetase family protein [Rickettsiales endosymbiont of Stachyamoeba lipophora]AZL15965.1 polyprenyl synthetase family protein [Rickettsiales endosymbiont of Stachyamoeba lipophora]
MPIQQLLAENAKNIEHELTELLSNKAQLPHNQIYEAIRYSTLSGGKRLRPFMVMATSKAFNVPTKYALRAAASIEMIHCYSLIHDDLPGLDNDDLRRGQPTCHKQFDEATAILAGDSLLTLAFEILSDPKTHPSAQIRCELIASLAKACGKDGMIGGQVLDLAPNYAKNIDDLMLLHQMKTGEMFAISCEAGAILGSADQHTKAALKAYAYNFGKAFQIWDDLEDGMEIVEVNNILNFLDYKQAKELLDSYVSHAREAIKILNIEPLFKLCELFND